MSTRKPGFSGSVFETHAQGTNHPERDMTMPKNHSEAWFVASH